MMLKNVWYVACTSQELQAGAPLARVICNEPVVLFRTDNGSPSILRDVCPHRLAPLSKGTVENNTLRCIYHGMAFNGQGQCVSIPSQDAIPPRAHVRSYPSQERYGLIWIFPGNPELASDTALPHRPWRESSQWNTDVVQYFNVQANHSYMSDNLLDLSHVAFLHSASIGFDARRLGNDPLEVHTEGQCVRTQRIFHNTQQAPAHKAWHELAAPITRTQMAEWTPPGNVTVLVRNENESEQVDLRADHFITPETDTSHHYYVALSRNFRVNDTTFSQQLDRDTRIVHMEDVDITQAQQRNQQWAANDPPMGLKADKAVREAHAIMALLSQAEAGQ